MGQRVARGGGGRGGAGRGQGQQELRVGLGLRPVQKLLVGPGPHGFSCLILTHPCLMPTLGEQLIPPASKRC